MTVYVGTKGDDVLASFTDTLIIGKAGNDLLQSFSEDDVVIRGGTGFDGLYGGSGNDKIKGGSGFDYLEGGAGDDLLKGGKGIDRIVGGDGSDILRGGKQDDTFVFNVIRTGTDTIRDFKPGKDTIKVYGADADQIIYDTTTGNLFFDDGTGPVHLAVLQGAPDFSADDLVVA